MDEIEGNDRIRILHVGTDSYIRNLVHSLYLNANRVFHRAESMSEGIRTFSAYPYDLVVCDDKLGDGSGVEFLFSG